MVYKRVVLGLLLLLMSDLAQAQSPKLKYAESITEEDLKKHLTIVASDKMEGRDTGSDGQRRAAEYITGQLKSFGVKPYGDAQTYLQSFDLYHKIWVQPRFLFKDEAYTMFEDFVPEGFVSLNEPLTLDVIFAGYGIQDKKHNHNDYKNTSLKDKLVIILEGVPDSTMVDWIGRDGVRKKIRLAKDLNAAVIMIVSQADQLEFHQLASERKAVLKNYNQVTFETPSVERNTHQPAFMINKKMAQKILGVGKKYDLWKKPLQTKLKDQGTLSIPREVNSLNTSNIVGKITGTTYPDEYLVISAHYDHLGTSDKGLVYNGADDDGSGTCALLEIAQSFAKATQEGYSPKRSILFIWFTGEEKGLFGSQYFTKNAKEMKENQIMADLNIDMIGRHDKEHDKDPRYVYIIGSDKLSSELHALSEKENKASVNFILDYKYNDPKDPNRFYYRSDHYNFAKNNIPVIFYFTGVHEDYHQPTDDVEKIEFSKYKDISRLIFGTAWELTHLDHKILVDIQKP